MSKKWGGSSGFLKGDKITFAIPQGADGPFDGSRKREYYSGIIVEGNGTKDSRNRYYTYQILDLKSNKIVTIHQDEIWEQF